MKYSIVERIVNSETEQSSSDQLPPPTVNSVLTHQLRIVYVILIVV